MTTSTETMKTRTRIEFLYLDLETCTRCRGTNRKLEEALAVVDDLLAATGTEVEVNKVHVRSAEQAREHRFVSSPTIRIEGRDIGFELRESSCGSEACTDGCGDSIACRVWVHGGEEHTEPPVAMIVDAILRAAEGDGQTGVEADTEHYELPENLARFFAGKEAIRAGGRTKAEPAPADCCAPAEQRTCCDAEEKAECCGAASGEGCGCR